MECSHQFYLSNQSLIDTSGIDFNSRNSLTSSKSYMNSSLVDKVNHYSIEKISKISSNSDFSRPPHDGVSLGSSPYLEVPSCKEINYQMDMNKNIEFIEKKHSFRRSKSWAKYHGSHLQNRPTKTHRRSRSDIGGITPCPLREYKTYIYGSSNDNNFQRFDEYFHECIAYCLNCGVVVKYIC